MRAGTAVPQLHPARAEGERAGNDFLFLLGHEHGGLTRRAHDEHGAGAVGALEIEEGAKALIVDRAVTVERRQKGDERAREQLMSHIEPAVGGRLVGTCVHLTTLPASVSSERALEGLWLAVDDQEIRPGMSGGPPVFLFPILEQPVVDAELVGEGFWLMPVFFLMARTSISSGTLKLRPGSVLRPETSSSTSLSASTSSRPAGVVLLGMSFTLYIVPIRLRQVVRPGVASRGSTGGM